MKERDLLYEMVLERRKSIRGREDESHNESRGCEKRERSEIAVIAQTV